MRNKINNNNNSSCNNKGNISHRDNKRRFSVIAKQMKEARTS